MRESQFNNKENVSADQQYERSKVRKNGREREFKLWRMCLETTSVNKKQLEKEKKFVRSREREGKGR